MRVPRRAGCTLMEMTAATFMVTFLVVALFDTSMLLLRTSLVSLAADRIARVSSFHGQESGSRWGPRAIMIVNPTHTESQLELILNQDLDGLDLNNTTIEIDWPDGGDFAGDRVRVTVSTEFRFVIPFLNLTDVKATAVSYVTH